ncbi:sulfurtransferase [Halorientalis brevis]|uniref:Sulfurtransferase n=1 Tax=Halorientalis brevis TaxID=1126241 RepID=A0ABD6CB22_9EURY|nr:rhodanese-like domain-containing protein [Halorientalis brevis]
MSEVVVPAGWLADRLEDVAIVDVRDAWEFDGIGHVPGAVNVPFESFRASGHEAEGEGGQDGEEGMLPGSDRFAALLGEAGIEREDEIVAYDDTHGVFAARFLVTAQLYGHDPAKLHLLDGDFSSWQLDHETTSDPTDVEPTSYQATPLAEGETPLVDADAVAAAIDSEAVIVDTREEWEFEEGHIPGAVRLDWQELVDDETRGLKTREEIERILDDRGITRDRRIVLYCNTARRISHTYTVLRHLGYGDVAFYEGSLTEWEAEGRPLETGS